jgi:hypothetical protein
MLSQKETTVNQLQFLQAQMVGLPAQASELEMETLVATYLAAKAQMGYFNEVGAEAKGRIAQLIDLTGREEWATASGKVIVPAPAIIVTYNAHALDGVRAMSKTVNRYILPFRNETLRAGGIRITGYDK